MAARIELDDYPWGEWLNGEAYRVREGEDYFCTQRSFIGRLRAEAASQDKTVRYKPYGTYVFFKAVPLPPVEEVFNEK